LPLASAGEALMEHTFALCREAREAGLTVTHARTIDVFCAALIAAAWTITD
jgi:hypothetical protein